MILYDVKLKPCPFCGAEMGMTALHYVFNQTNQAEYRIEGKHLLSCPFSLIGLKPPFSINLDWLVKSWNTRAESEVDTQE